MYRSISDNVWVTVTRTGTGTVSGTGSGSIINYTYHTIYGAGDKAKDNNTKKQVGTAVAAWMSECQKVAINTTNRSTSEYHPISPTLPYIPFGIVDVSPCL